MNYQPRNTHTKKTRQEKGARETLKADRKTVLRAFYLLEAVDMKVLKYLNAMTGPSLLPLMLKYNNKS